MNTALRADAPVSAFSADQLTHHNAGMPSGTSQPRAWMRLPSGAHLDLITPDSNAWTDMDLAVRLSRTARWGGESAWPLSLSVAQHSLLVLELRRRAAPAPLSVEDELLELLHDAEEGFLGFDCISPLKAVLGGPFRAVADRLMQAVARRYHLPPWTPEGHHAHKLADTAAAASEAVHCVGWTHAEVRDILGIQAPMLETDPLAACYGGVPWEPWPLDVAAGRFHDVLQSLRGARDAGVEGP